MTTPALQRALHKKLLEENFYFFVRNAWPHVDNKTFKDNWHIKALCDHLQAVHDGDINRLLINISPGTGKSLIVSVLYPAWVWCTKADHQFIATSHSMRRTNKDARRMRNLVTSDWYQSRWPIGFSRDQNEKLNFENERGGSRIGEPFKQMTGARGNCLIIDDPISVGDAASAAMREAVTENFEDAIQNRLNDLEEDAIIVIMQRTHEEDISGWILERPDLGYEYLVIPMEYEGPRDEQPTCLGWSDPRTEVGELMFPAHFPESAIKKLKAGITPTGYAGQYQQRPAPKEAGTIDVAWFKDTRFDLKVDEKGNTGPHCYPGMLFYMTSDHAPEGTGDYNVLRVWGIDHKRHLWLVDSFREKCTMDIAFGVVRDGEGKLIARPQGALALIKKWKPQWFFPEDDNNWKASGKFFMQALKESRVWVRVTAQSPHGIANDKVVKAQSFCILASIGQVHIPNGSMGELTLAEYQVFPNGKHDDQVDADGMIGRVYNLLRTGTDPKNVPTPVPALTDYLPVRTYDLDEQRGFWP